MKKKIKLGEQAEFDAGDVRITIRARRKPQSIFDEAAELLENFLEWLGL